MVSSIAINTKNSIRHYSFICTQLNGFKHCYQILTIQFKINHLFAQLNGFQKSKWLNIFIWPQDGALTGTTTRGQSGPNVNEGVLHILQSCRTGASPSDGLVSYPRHMLRQGEEGPTPSAEMQLAYSYSPSW